MDFRKIFDRIPDEFDRWRPRYCSDLFDDLIAYADLRPGREVLEIGPGTGQATAPILQTGCTYTAIELGEHLTAFMKQKFSNFPNFSIVNADFETCDLGHTRFDLVYSAATIQWIPEPIAFSKTYDLLKPGGTLAMFLTRAEYRSSNEPLYQAIQKIYDEFFHPTRNYTCHLAYENATDYGFINFEKREYHGQRTFTADEYAAFSATHCDHIALEEPYRTKFFEGIRQAVFDAGNQITFNDTYVLYLAKKPE